MTQVPLRDYLERMRARLREGQYADVITLGQHVLRYYPKHIETYRLLAEARLESNDPVAAVDLFQRVRSADPENIIALVGLSIIYEQRKQLEEAIWHLERAFEIQPANAELRKELLRLHAEYDGAPRERLKLTPGGLARLYTRQGLYSQAIQEFRGLLRRDPTRADIQVALAETLYRVGRKQEAADVALALLEKLPYCLKANLLLGSLWSENGVPEAEALLRRAQSLDPEHSVARELVPDHWDDSPPPTLPPMSEEATGPASMPIPAVPKLDESVAHDLSLLASITPSLEPAAKIEAPPAPQAATETGAKAVPTVSVESQPAAFSERQPAPGPGMEVAAQAQPIAPIQQEPEPLKPAVEPVKQQPVVAPPVQVAKEKTTSPLAPAESPSPPSTAGEPKPVRRLQPSLPRIGPTIPGALDKLPSWLRGTAPPSTQSAMSAPPAGMGESAPATVDRSGAFRPARHATGPIIRAPQNLDASTTDLPDWLTRARRAARSGEVDENIAATSALEEKPAWLTEADAESPPAEAATASPEWLRADSTGASSDQARAEPEGTLPAWLSASEPESQVEAPPSGVVLPDWLSSPKEKTAPVPTEPATAVPAWLQATKPEAPHETSAQGTPSPELLKTPSSGESQPPAGTATPAEETDETIPDWLRELMAATETESVATGTIEAPPGEAVGVKPPAAEVIETEPSEPVSVNAPAAEVIETEPSAEIGVKPPAAEVIVTEPSAGIEVEPAVSEVVRPEPSAPVAETTMPAQAEEKPETEADSLLTQARGQWTGGDRAAAIDLYEKVLKQGPRLTSEVIADFEQFVQEPDAPMPAHRLLGDAYSMVGRFKEALEQYRIVLGR